MFASIYWHTVVTYTYYVPVSLTCQLTAIVFCLQILYWFWSQLYFDILFLFIIRHLILKFSLFFCSLLGLDAVKFFQGPREEVERHLHWMPLWCWLVTHWRVYGMGRPIGHLCGPRRSSHWHPHPRCYVEWFYFYFY